MKKLAENQGKILSELYSKSQILAIALYFFGTVDDIDFSIIENIIRRKLGLSVGVPAMDIPLHESVDSLLENIEIKEIKNGKEKPIHVYTSKYSDGKERPSTLSSSLCFSIGQPIPKDLYDVMGEIYNDSVEIMVRRASFDQRIPRIRTNGQISDYNFAKREGLIEDAEYRLTKLGSLLLKRDGKLESAKKEISEFNENNFHSDTLISLMVQGYTSVSKVGITKRGRVFLVAKDYEDKINYMGNVLAEKGFDGYYMDRYLTSLYDLEMAGRIKSFESGLRASDYLEYCRAHRLDDLSEGMESRHRDRSAKHIWMNKD